MLYYAFEGLSLSLSLRISRGRVWTNGMFMWPVMAAAHAPAARPAGHLSDYE